MLVVVTGTLLVQARKLTFLPPVPFRANVDDWRYSTRRFPRTEATGHVGTNL